MKMIQDSMEGKIDMILTKSISRFARNTLDTLKYVRMLKEKNVAILFEEENINTGSGQGELVLTLLSAMAQQESENKKAQQFWRNTIRNFTNNNFEEKFIRDNSRLAFYFESFQHKQIENPSL